MKLKALLKEQQSGPIDYQYFLEQVGGLQTAIEDFQQEFSSALESAEEQTGNSQYKQMQNQVARYLMGAEKQVSGMYKMIDKVQDRARLQRSQDTGEL
jgi:hypothetical protein|tara:strand:+ start:168 stop:461 length:294 start_codon:yes stop_codon:yes gene_type:complete